MVSRRQFLVGSLSLAAGCLLPRFALADDREFVGRDVFERLMARAASQVWRRLPIGELVGEIGMSLLETPYVGHTLELYDDKEVCAINLEGMDCATFFEAALAMARLIRFGRSSAADFVRQVELIRYRGGKMAGYLSRLHYASDYFFDNERKGVVRVVTGELPGAEPFEHPVSYMSKHPDAYRQLKSHPELVPGIARMEAEINARKTLYLPADRISAAEPQLHSGDIIGITTRKPGLDCSHTGLAYRDDAGVIRFLHASSLRKKVVLGDELSKLVEGLKGATGIMVARPLEPRH